MTRICWLDSTAARRRRVAGGKGAGLAALRANGYRVPDGFVVTTRAFQDFIAASGIAPLSLGTTNPGTLDRIRSRIATQSFPPRLAAAITRFAARLGGPVAVRSSLVAEDGAARSFAGQLESVLSVEGGDACLAAARQVYGSLFAPPLASYAATSGTHATPSLAVVVQRMVAARAAGVAFSADPMTGERRVIVEAAAGVGDRLVRGTAPPARFEIQDGRLERSDRRDVADDDLPDAVLLDLASVVRSVAERAGCPQDVEWAWDGSQLWLLQARPITALRGGHTYSRRLVGDMAPGLIKPLLWSTHTRSMTRRVFGRLFTELLGPTNFDFTLLIRRFHSRMYADMTLFGELLEKIGLPANFFETLTRDDRAGRRPPVTPRLVARLPRLARFLWRNTGAARAIDGFLARHDGALEPFCTAAWRDDDLTGLLIWADRLIDLHGESQWHTFVGAMNVAVRNRLLRRFTGRHAPGVEPGDLMLGLSDLKSLEPNGALRRLAADPGWRAFSLPLLATGDDGRIRAMLNATEAGQRLCLEVDAFLARFGYLASNGTDFTEPRWAEAPGPVWQALARQIDRSELAPRDHAETTGADAIREAARDAVRRRLGWSKRRGFELLLASTAAFIGRRERLSAAMTEDAYQARRLFLAVGDRLVARGDLARPDDVFLLYLDELQRLSRGALPAAADIVRVRRTELDADAVRDADESFCGDHPSPGPLPDAGEELVLTGIPASPGVVMGYARLVRDPASAPASLSSKDVLVVPFTDVGWTPLLATVGGVIAECGGQLSHTAIVAREYGLPTVVSVSRALRLIWEGQPVTVDGTRGLVYLAHTAPPADAGSGETCTSSRSSFAPPLAT